jgi:hypothetical protein
MNTQPNGGHGVHAVHRLSRGRRVVCTERQPNYRPKSYSQVGRLTTVNSGSRWQSDQEDERDSRLLPDRTARVCRKAVGYREWSNEYNEHAECVRMSHTISNEAAGFCQHGFGT